MSASSYRKRRRIFENVKKFSRANTVYASVSCLCFRACVCVLVSKEFQFGSTERKKKEREANGKKKNDNKPMRKHRKPMQKERKQKKNAKKENFIV